MRRSLMRNASSSSYCQLVRANKRSNGWLWLLPSALELYVSFRLRFVDNVAAETSTQWKPKGLRRSRELAYSTLSNCVPAAVHSPETWKSRVCIMYSESTLGWSLTLTCLQEEGAPLKPSALIKDSFEPGDTARVLLVSKHEFLERNELATSNWGNEAFGFSPVAAHRRGRVLAEQARLKAQQEEEKRIAAEKRRKELEEQAAALLESGGEDIGKIFDRDWAQMQYSLELIPPVQRIEQTEAIKKLLLQYYQPLRDLFRYYSNLLDDPDDQSPGYSMSCNEFVNLVLDAGITLGSLMSQQLFVYAVSGNKANRRTPTMGMNRVAMLEAILIAAAVVALSKAQELGVSGATLKLDVDAVQHMLDMHIMPVADQTTSSAGVRAQLSSAEVVPVIIRGTPAMKALFSTFADCEEDDDDADEADAGAGSDDDPIDSLAMTEGAYMNMLAAIGVLGMSSNVSCPKTASRLSECNRVLISARLNSPPPERRCTHPMHCVHRRCQRRRGARGK